MITDIDPELPEEIGKNGASVKDAITDMLGRHFSDGTVSDLRIRDHAPPHTPG